VGYLKEKFDITRLAKALRFNMNLYWVGVRITVSASYLLLFLFFSRGETWLIQPQFYSAFAFGLITVLVPFLIMQPAMGAGIAATNTPEPWLNRLKSLINHGIFGCGLYLAAKFLQLFN
jgi:hypothetical protein